MIDIHSHILPDIDDGAEDMETAIKMAEIAVSEGITKMIATPHFIEEDREIEKEKVLEKVNELNSALKQQSIDLEILPGEEIFLTPNIAKLYEEDRILTLCNQKKYILIELPLMTIPLYAKDVIHSLTLKGLRVIIAHPERNREISKDMGKLKEFLKMGALVQVNTLSLMGVFGRRAKHTAQKIIRFGMANFLATDCHTPRSRSPRMQEARKRLSQADAELLMETNPAKILTNEDIKPIDVSSRGKGMSFLKRMTVFFDSFKEVKGAKNEI
ncbi:MAG TPA: capsular biosynthesis protein [Thermoanaerobacterales bacterium]|nr:capsular biosynthesis protein [Thermoanaerobacterales bacterium]